MALDTQFELSYNKQLKQRLESVHDHVQKWCSIRKQDTIIYYNFSPTILERKFGFPETIIIEGRFPIINSKALPGSK